MENSKNRQRAFYKRRAQLLQKASELTVKFDARVGLVIFSSKGKMVDYCSPASSWKDLMENYEEATHTDQPKRIRGYSGDELSSLNLEEVSQLEQELEDSVTRVRERKHHLLNQQLYSCVQQLDTLRRKEPILEDSENQQAAAALSGGEVKLRAEMAAFGAFYYGGGGESSSNTALQLTPAAPQLHPGFLLQPTQPNLQDPAYDHGRLQDELLQMYGHGA